jgi:RNA polymerase sigma-70 factor (sigma-E family)
MGTSERDREFAAYVAARQRSLLRTAWLLSGDWAAAEDLVQTALLRTWRRWDRVAAAGDPDAYVRRVVVTGYLSARRRRWTGELPTAAPPETAAVDGYGAADLRDALGRLLPALPPGQRAVLVLRHYEDLTEAQTAAVLGCSVGTVKSQNARALARLRTALTEIGEDVR